MGRTLVALVATLAVGAVAGPSASAATITGIQDRYFCGPPAAGPTSDLPGDTHALPRFKVVYAYPSDQPNRFVQYADEIASLMAQTSGAIASASGAKGLRLDLGTPCGADRVDITTVALPRTRAEYVAQFARFAAIKADVLNALGPAPAGQRRNVVIFADGLRWANNEGAADSATAVDSRIADPVDYPLSLGGRTAVLPGDNETGLPGSFFLDSEARARVITLHEILHTLGALSTRAPNASPTGHCTDRYDVMCYPEVGVPWTIRCPDPLAEDSLRLDCGNDDYFHPTAGLRGKDGGPLWNVHDSVFLCAIAHCGSGSGTPPVAVLPDVVGEPGTTITLDASATTDDTGLRRFRWDLDGAPGFEISTEGVPTVAATVPASGSVPVRVRVSDADGRTAEASATISAPPAPAGPATAGPGPDHAPTPGAASPRPPASTPVPRVSALRVGGRRRVRATLSATVRLDRRARTTVELLRLVPGRRTGRRCSTTARKGRRCTAERRVRRVVATLAAGRSRKVSLGRVTRAGRYVVRVSPAGGRSRSVTLRIR